MAKNHLRVSDSVHTYQRSYVNCSTYLKWIYYFAPNYVPSELRRTVVAN